MKKDPQQEATKWDTVLDEITNRDMFVCMFVWGFSSHSRIFHSYGDITIAAEGLQILSYAPHTWPLSSEGS